MSGRGCGCFLAAIVAACVVACGHPKDGQTCGPQEPCGPGLFCDESVGLCYAVSDGGPGNGPDSGSLDGGNLDTGTPDSGDIDGGAVDSGNALGCDGTCRAGEVCSGGKCVTIGCVGVVCDGGACAGTGQCFPTSCLGNPCPQQEVCVANQCQDVLCAGITCPGGQVCSDGQCVDAICGFADAGTVCAAATCTGTTFTPPRTCGDGGTCGSVLSTSCMPYVCNAAACKTSCSAQSDCASGYYCDASSACVAQEPNGGSCSESFQCESGNCVDGYCCNSACVGPCVSCGLPGALGTCSAAPADTDPRNACGDYTCNGAAACQTSCAGSACSATCKAADYCNASGQCVAKLAQGAACVSSGCECATGNCADGFCCDGACSLGCQACNVAGKQGTCSTLAPGSVPTNGGCTGYLCEGAATCPSSCTPNACGSASQCQTSFFCDSAMRTCNPLKSDGVACATACECASGTCKPYFVDADHDGYGTSATNTFCGNSPPVGYSTISGDCCDSDATAHPNQSMYFSFADNCGSFDWNCDRTLEQQDTSTGMKCVFVPADNSCNTTPGWANGPPACGMTATYYSGSCGVPPTCAQISSAQRQACH